MKVLIGDEGLHGWIYRSVAKNRSGLQFQVTNKSHFTIDPETGEIKKPVLRVVAIENKSPADNLGLKVEDVVISVDGKTDRDEILSWMALKENETAELTLVVKHPNDQIETMNLLLDEKPIYAGLVFSLLKYIPDEEGPDFKQKSIVFLIYFMLIITFVRCLLRFIQEYIVRRVTQRTLMALRQDTYNTAIRLPLGFYSSEGMADTLSRFVQDSNRINNGVVILLGKCIREPLKMISMLTFAFMINPKMTLVIVLGAPVAIGVIGLLGRKMKKATKRMLENWAKVLARLQETLQGIRVVKAYHREEYERKRFDQLAVKLLKQQFRLARVDAAMGPILESLGAIVATVVMLVAVRWLSSSQMAVDEFFALVAFLATTAESGRKLGNVFGRLHVADAAAARVFELMDQDGESSPDNAIELNLLQSSLEMKDVCFTYPNSPNPTINNVNLTVQAGQTVAIVGPNGSGKTTLLSLIPKFFELDSGQILMDGKDISDASLSSLREQIGIVTQQTVVFNDTIMANIAYGNPDATEQEIIEAAKKAYAHEFIEQTEDGYATIVGEQGATLSGGQLQRLSIARAILRDPAILIFDEATSQIDSESEAKIHQAISEFSHGRTSFMIAHRLSTIVEADKIVVMDQGEIVSEGTHQELLESCHLYQQLYQTQFGGA